MVIELVMNFTDAFQATPEDPNPNMEFSYTLNAPEGFEVSGGQLFVENSQTSELQRFSFRIDRDANGDASLTVLEMPEV